MGVRFVMTTSGIVDIAMSSDSVVVVVAGKGGRKSGMCPGADHVGCGRRIGDRVTPASMSTSTSISSSSSDASESDSESELARY